MMVYRLRVVIWASRLYGGFIKRDGYSIINYNVGVYNGAGINSKDNNKSKDFIARLIVKPIKGLSISGSYMYSEVVHGGNQYMKAPRWAVGAIYDVRHWIVRSEFAQADFGGNTTNAFYALAGYHFEKPWTVAARYEFINDKLGVLDQQRVTLGGVYKPFKFLRLQATQHTRWMPSARRISSVATLWCRQYFS